MVPERGCRVPGPARVPEQAAGQRHQVGLFVNHDRFGLLRFGDQADRNDRHIHLGPHALGKRHLIARPQRNLLRGRYAPGRDIEPVAAACLQRASKHDRLFDIPAALDPIGG